MCFAQAHEKVLKERDSSFDAMSRSKVMFDDYFGTIQHAVADQGTTRTTFA
jgi:hypothetical protein